MALWWIANIVGLVVVVPLVVVLANRVIRQALEAAHYADDILDNARLVAGNVEPIRALADTRAHAGDLAAGATRYVAALDRLT